MDVSLPDGRVLRAHDSGSDGPALLWHHGTPQTGALLAPVVEAAQARGLRAISYGRPGYGGSTDAPGRAVADAAGDAVAVLDALGVDRAVTMGASGGGPHALACVALAPERFTAAATLAGLAPFDGSDGWFEGMVSPGALRAAVAGRTAREAHDEPFDEAQFIAADRAALEGEWGALGADAGAAGTAGGRGQVDDDLAFVAPWGFEVAGPLLVVHGSDDRVVPVAHAGRLPATERWIRPGDGHISVLAAVGAAMDWLRVTACR